MRHLDGPQVVGDKKNGDELLLLLLNWGVIGIMDGMAVGNGMSLGRGGSSNDWWVNQGYPPPPPPGKGSWGSALNYNDIKGKGKGVKGKSGHRLGCDGSGQWGHPPAKKGRWSSDEQHKSEFYCNPCGK